MATTRDPTSGLSEECDTCETETAHQVSIQMQAEGDDENAEFSREPYRVAECQRCGTRTSQRMNDA